MAFYLGTVDLPTQKKQQMVDITARVRAEVKSSGVQNGLCTVFAPHSTGAIAINENTDPDVQTDILNALERAVPQKGKYYQHEEGNAHAHLSLSLAWALAGRASSNGCISRYGADSTRNFFPEILDQVLATPISL